MRTGMYDLSIGQKVYCKKDFKWNHQFVIGDEFIVKSFNQLTCYVILKSELYNILIILKDTKLIKWDDTFNKFFDINPIKMEQYEDWE